MEAFFELGILGFLIVLSILWDVIIKFIRTRKTKILLISFTALMAHSLSALGIFTVQNAVSGMVLVISLGILI